MSFPTLFVAAAPVRVAVSRGSDVGTAAELDQQRFVKQERNVCLIMGC